MRAKRACRSRHANVRQVSRFLDETDARRGPRNRSTAASACRLQYRSIMASGLPAGRAVLPGLSCFENGVPARQPARSGLPDNAILANTLALQQKFRHRARHVGLEGHQLTHQSGHSRRARRRLFQRPKPSKMRDLLVSGVQQLPQNFWEKHGKGMESWQQQSRNLLPECAGPLVREWKTINSYMTPVRMVWKPIVRKLESISAILELTTDYRTERNNVWGVTRTQSRAESGIEPC